jgi:hypothetical protein
MGRLFASPSDSQSLGISRPSRPSPPNCPAPLDFSSRSKADSHTQRAVVWSTLTQDDVGALARKTYFSPHEQSLTSRRIDVTFINLNARTAKESPSWNGSSKL